MSDNPYYRQVTFRQFIDVLSKRRGVANDGNERAGAISRPLRDFVRSTPPDHNYEDLLAVVPRHLRDELMRVGELYASTTATFEQMFAEGLALVPKPGRRRRRSRPPRRSMPD